jgi:hypothetical protein
MHMTTWQDRPGPQSLAVMHALPVPAVQTLLLQYWFAGQPSSLVHATIPPSPRPEVPFDPHANANRQNESEISNARGEFRGVTPAIQHARARSRLSDS